MQTTPEQESRALNAITHSLRDVSMPSPLESFKKDHAKEVVRRVANLLRQAAHDPSEWGNIYHDQEVAALLEAVGQSQVLKPFNEIVYGIYTHCPHLHPLPDYFPDTYDAYKKLCIDSNRPIYNRYKVFAALSDLIQGIGLHAFQKNMVEICLQYKNEVKKLDELKTEKDNLEVFEKLREAVAPYWFDDEALKVQQQGEDAYHNTVRDLEELNVKIPAHRNQIEELSEYLYLHREILMMAQGDKNSPPFAPILRWPHYCWLQGQRQIDPQMSVSFDEFKAAVFFLEMNNDGIDTQLWLSAMARTYEETCKHEHLPLLHTILQIHEISSPGITGISSEKFIKPVPKDFQVQAPRTLSEYYWLAGFKNCHYLLKADQNEIFFKSLEALPKKDMKERGYKGWKTRRKNIVAEEGGKIDSDPPESERGQIAYFSHQIAGFLR